MPQTLEPRSRKTEIRKVFPSTFRKAQDRKALYLRGGSFDFGGSFARSAMRSNLTQGGRIQGSSFRLARTI